MLLFCQMIARNTLFCLVVANMALIGLVAAMDCATGITVDACWQGTDLTNPMTILPMEYVRYAKIRLDQSSHILDMLRNDLITHQTCYDVRYPKIQLD